MLRNGKEAAPADSGNGLYYLDPQEGNAPAVLLLHALGADCETWGYQTEAVIRAGMRPLIPDFPGFGRSALPDGKHWSIQYAAARMTALLDERGVETAAVVGLSLGGTVALQMALDYPQRVTRLVIANSFAALRPNRWNEWLYLGRRFVTASLSGIDAQANRVAWRVFPAPEQAELRAVLVQKVLAANPRAYREAMRSLALFDVRRRLGEINMPTLIISGAEDTTVPLQNQAVLARGIRGAERVIIPRAGHGVSIDQPEAFNRALLKFLGESSDASLPAVD